MGACASCKSVVTDVEDEESLASLAAKKKRKVTFLPLRRHTLKRPHSPTHERVTTTPGRTTTYPLSSRSQSRTEDR